MNKSKTEDELYWDLVEKFIEVANEASGDIDLGIVNSAIMNAATRFNAFYISASSESRNDLKEDKDDAIQRFGANYKRLLADNLDDYIENYKVYMREDS